MPIQQRKCRPIKKPLKARPTVMVGCLSSANNIQLRTLSRHLMSRSRVIATCRNSTKALMVGTEVEAGVAHPIVAHRAGALQGEETNLQGVSRARLSDNSREIRWMKTMS
jgi:hypothetical protein